MSPEEKKLLERVATLSEENNQILHSMRRSARFGFVAKVFYWILILAISYGAYVYVQPYVDQLMKTYEGLKGTASSVQKSASQLSGLDKLMNYLPK